MVGYNRVYWTYYWTGMYNVYDKRNGKTDIPPDYSGSDDEEEETEEDVDVSEYETIDYEKLAQRAKKNE